MFLWKDNTFLYREENKPDWTKQIKKISLLSKGVNGLGKSRLLESTSFSPRLYVEPHKVIVVAGIFEVVIKW